MAREAAAAAMMAARNLASDSALTDDTAVGDEAEESGYATADEEEKQEQNGAAPYDHDVQMEDAHDQAADAAAADLAAAHLASPIAFRRRPEEEVEERGTRVARRLKAARGGAVVRGGKHCRSKNN